MFSTKRLDIYLIDHFAGATLGLELSRRAAENNRGTELGDFLQRLHEEIVEDRRTLEDVMERFAVDRSPVKSGSAWLLEKAGRLKVNGQLRGYSPLSRSSWSSKRWNRASPASALSGRRSRMHSPKIQG
jgi:hypothetical protein